MKRVNFRQKLLEIDIVEGISFVWLQWYKQKLPLVIFIGLCLNLLVAPIVYAAESGNIERRSAWAFGVLGFITFGLVIYLFDVIFRPERY